MISLKLKYLIITSVIFGILYGLFLIFDPSLGFYTYWNENFDSYADESLLNGQGGWTTTSNVKVQNDYYTSSPNGIKRDSNDPFLTKAGDELNTGILSFNFYDSGSANGFGFFLTNDTGNFDGFVFYEYKVGGAMKVYYDNAFSKIYTTGLDYNAWHTAYIEWNCDTREVRIKIDALEWSEWFTLLTSGTDITGGLGVGYGYGSDIYFDDFYIDSVEPPPLVPRVWATSPASETEITDLNTSFEFSWEDLDDWDTLSVVFKNRATGIFSLAQELLITDTPAGSEVFNFSDLAPDRNGKFYFFATSTRQVMEVMSGMFLTGRYSYEWSEDLVDPEHWFTFNIGGISQIFSMSEFSTWYLENSKFAEPTAMFSAIVGFFEPVFNKIGEFGNRISDYFKSDEAYSQGYEIGKAIPYFSYFVGQVSDFIGGFPLMKWLFVIILLLVGIFVFRLILKFIPFIGGG